MVPNKATEDLEKKKIRIQLRSNGQGIDELEQAILRLLNLPDGNLPSPTVWDNLHCEILGHTFQYALHRPEEAIKSLERGFLPISFENKAN